MSLSSGKLLLSSGKLFVRSIKFFLSSGQLLSVIFHQWSSASHQWSSVSHQWSSVSHQWSSVSHQLSWLGLSFPKPQPVALGQINPSKATTPGFGTNESLQSNNLGPSDKNPHMRHQRALGEICIPLLPNIWPTIRNLELVPIFQRVY